MKDNQVLFAIGNEPDGSPIVIFGISTEAWEHMRNGRTHGFDLTRVGLPFKVMMYGGKDLATVKALINSAITKDTKDVSSLDLSVKPRGSE